MEIGVSTNDIGLIKDIDKFFISKYLKDVPLITQREIKSIQEDLSHIYIDNEKIVNEITKAQEIIERPARKSYGVRVKTTNDFSLDQELEKIVQTRYPAIKPKIPKFTKIGKHEIEAKSDFNPSMFPGVDKTWLKHYDVLLEYRRENSRYWPLKSDVLNGIEIGKWCLEQQKSFKKKVLAKTEETLLKNIGFEFDNEADFWNHRYQLLLDYRQDFPDKWPNTRDIYKRIQLGLWCKQQRKAFKKKKLTTSQIALLDTIGFEWDIEKAYWPLTIELLKDYRSEYPSRWPKKNELYRGYDLYDWCQIVRIEKSRLSNEQIKELDAINFNWEVKKDYPTQNLNDWKKMYDTLRLELKNSKSGHLPTKNKLGTWLSIQRKLMGSGKLPKYQSELLERLGIPGT